MFIVHLRSPISARITVGRSRGLLALLGLTAWLLCSPLRGLQIHEDQAGRHLRFEEGTFPASPEPNQSLWAADHDGGVGWSVSDTRKGFALISPRHFVGSNHFRPPLNSQIAFRGMDGQVHFYTYLKSYQLKNARNENTDIFIGELAENIPARHGLPLFPIEADRMFWRLAPFPLPLNAGE